MKLYLARHGDYLANAIPAGNPLSEEGKAALMKLAGFLKPLQIEVSAIFHSSKLRAKETAEILSKGFHCQQAVQEKQGLNPQDAVTHWVSEINESEEDWLLVGHLPFMSRLTSELIIQKEKDIVVFQTGTIVCLEKISRIAWNIDWVLNPALFSK